MKKIKNIRAKRQRPAQHAAGAREAFLMRHPKQFSKTPSFERVAARNITDTQRVGSVRLYVFEKNKNSGWHPWAEI